jgi:hypothetical protein
VLSAQTQPIPQYAGAQPAASSSVLTVEDIVGMLKAGLSEEVVIAKIRKADRAFDLSPAQMVDLKKSGVGDAVLTVMIDPRAAVAPAPVPISLTKLPRASGATPDAGVSEAAIAANLNNPDAPHDSGIYLYSDKDGEKAMTLLERAAYQGAKTGGMFLSGLTYGAKKVKTKAIIPGPRASIRAKGGQPVFFFYFEEKSAGLGKAGFGAQTVSNPSQFALIKLEEKKSNRETIIGEFSMWGASSGNNQKEMIPFKSEKIRTGAYRVTLSEALKPGEYCFIGPPTTPMVAAPMPMAGAMAPGAVDIFDFGVNPSD